MKYLDVIEKTYASTSDLSERGVCVAKKAAYLARRGEFDVARSLISQLRSSREIYCFPRASIWISIADGILDFFVGNEDSAAEKWRRARVLSSSFEMFDLAALVGAWQAHYAFGKFDFDLLHGGIQTALEHVDLGNAERLARLFLVLGESSHLAGSRARANEWYSRSRICAQKIGDETITSSTMYNSAAMQIVNIRWHLFARMADSGDSSLTVVDANSVESFDGLVGITAWPDLTPVLKAQALSLSGRSLEAKEIYDQFLDRLQGDAHSRHLCWLTSDWAYCGARTGNLEWARRVAMLSLDQVSPRVQIDDLASTYSRLSQTFALCGLDGEAELYADLSRAAWINFEAIRETVNGIVVQCDRFLDVFSLNNLSTVGNIAGGSK